jgi:LysM repeat protein
MQIRKLLLVVSFLIGCMPLLKAQKLTTEQYIAIYKGAAIEEMQRSGVPAAIKLAQGIVETQSGNGWLVLNSNNHFGIKCKNNWSGKTVSYDDDARGECFRVYESARDSYKDHSDFLRNNPRYSFLFQFSQDDYKSWAFGLKQAGYATNKTYPQQLIKVIEDYNLQKYSLQALGKIPMDNDDVPATPVYAGNNNPTRSATRPAPTVTPAKAPPAMDMGSYPKGVFEINGRKVVFVAAGTSLIQLANEKNIRLSKLVKFNDLEDDRPLKRNTFIFLQRKAKKGKNDYHTVATTETMHDIAQAEGVQMKWLRRRNKMSEGEEPAAGQRLALNGYASAKPGLAVNAPKQEEQEDFSPRKALNGLKQELERASEGSAASVPVAKEAPVQQQQGLPEGMVEDLKKVAEVTPVTSRAPASAPTSNTPAPVKTPTAKPGATLYHDVQPKETLFAIARQYNTTISQLQQWNNLQGNDIKIGQRLLVGK